MMILSGFSLNGRCREERLSWLKKIMRLILPMRLSTKRFTRIISRKRKILNVGGVWMKVEKAYGPAS